MSLTMGMSFIPPTMVIRQGGGWLWAAAAVGGDRMEAMAVVGGSWCRQGGGNGAGRGRQCPAQNRAKQGKHSRAVATAVAGDLDGGGGDDRRFEWVATDGRASTVVWCSERRDREGGEGGGSRVGSEAGERLGFISFICHLTCLFVYFLFFG